MKTIRLSSLLGMLLLWRMEMDPYAALVDKLDFLTLFGGQLAAWPLMSLWLAPTYAWLLLASAGATRSPFMLAITPILALLLGERILLGSAGLAAVLSRHFPQLGSSAGAYGGFYWQGLADLPSLGLGLLFAGLALWRDGRVVRTAPRPVVGWDQLSDCPWHLLDIEPYRTAQLAGRAPREVDRMVVPPGFSGRPWFGISYYSSFGCPEACTFCCSPQVSDLRSLFPPSSPGISHPNTGQ